MLGMAIGIYRPPPRSAAAGNVFYFAAGLPAGWSFTRASSATSWAWPGTLAMVGAHVPRAAYDPISQASGGILIEPASTNLLPAHRPSWAVSGGAVSVGRGIDGSFSGATLLRATSPNATAAVGITAALGWYAGSVYIRRVRGIGGVYVALGGVERSITGYLTLRGRWWRAYVVAHGADPVLQVRIEDVGDEVLVDWAQIEPGTVVTSPIAGGQTRAAESLTHAVAGTITHAALAAVAPMHDTLGQYAIYSVAVAGAGQYTATMPAMVYPDLGGAPRMSRQVVVG